MLYLHKPHDLQFLVFSGYNGEIFGKGRLKNGRKISALLTCPNFLRKRNDYICLISPGKIFEFKDSDQTYKGIDVDIINKR